MRSGRKKRSRFTSSNSFGDATAARVGVNAIPEIKEFDLTSEDKVIVLASDGVWEFLEN